jgi:RNA polymerase sigma-70 factor (ECF subfamily)
MLDEMPAARDRELLLRFYLNDEEKEQICQELHLSHEHFNRVIFRAQPLPGTHRTSAAGGRPIF